MVTITESPIELTHGRKGKFAVLISSGNEDPISELDQAVRKLVGTHEHMEFIDIDMNNPWVRVVVLGVNEMYKSDLTTTE